jgi:dTMP kinase
MTVRGRFITFEGIDGAGKSTQIEVVANALRGRALPLVITREPGGTPLGEALREVILHQPMTIAAETLLMFAARAEHLERVIRPALADGTWVLCDRFTDATFAYQSGGRGMSAERIGDLEQWVHPDLQPDLTLLFDVPPEVAAERLARARSADRFESEQVDFFGRVRRAYLDRARDQPLRFIVIDGTQPADVIGTRLAELMQRWNG